MTPDLPDEDATAETLADTVTDLVEELHPFGSPNFRRQVARLYLKQILGVEKPPGAISQSAVGRPFRIDRRRVAAIEAAALAKLRRHLREKHPELFT